MKQLHAWHETKLGLTVFTIVELAIAYGFASLSIDRGNFLYYLLGLVFLFGALRNFVKLIGVLFHVSRPKR
jgi:hypothetical protein